MKRPLGGPLLLAREFHATAGEVKSVMGVWGRLSRDGPAFSIDFWWIDRRAACTARTMPRQWPEQGQGSVQDLGWTYTIPN